MARFHTWNSWLDLTKGNGPKGNILERVMPLRRYKAALEKANYASLALKDDPTEEEGTLGEDEEELQAVLARARRAAAAKKEDAAAAAEGPSLARIAEDAAARRAADEAQRLADAAEGDSSFCLCLTVHLSLWMSREAVHLLPKEIPLSFDVALCAGIKDAELVPPHVIGSFRHVSQIKILEP